MRIAGATGRAIDVGGPTTRLMGVVNVTPDSFSDGGQFLDRAAAVEQGVQLAAAGADIIDVGGESTRPGHEPVSDDQQLERVLPVIEGLREALPTIPLSIDTTRCQVAAAALDAGADWINDTLALTGDPELASLAAERDCPIVLMHRFHPRRTTADEPRGRALVESIARHLESHAAAAMAAGVRRSNILLDPGVGFGTHHPDNWAIHAHIDTIRRLGWPLLVGPSRKSFLGDITGKEAQDRLCATAASVATLTLGGVEVIRVHDVAEMLDVVRVADAFRSAGAKLEGADS